MTDWDTILKQRPISEAYSINPPNFMNIYESLAFMHNNNLETQKKILEKLEKIEKMLEEKWDGEHNEIEKEQLDF